MKKQNNDTIRAHFIRSVLYVLLLLAVCVIPFALAQSRSRGNTSASAATAVRNPDSVSNVATAPTVQWSDWQAIRNSAISETTAGRSCTISTTTLHRSGRCPRPSPMCLRLALISPMISLFPRAKLGTSSPLTLMASSLGSGLSTVSMFSFTPTTRACLARKFIAQ